MRDINFLINYYEITHMVLIKHFPCKHFITTQNQMHLKPNMKFKTYKTKNSSNLMATTV